MLSRAEKLKRIPGPRNGDPWTAAEDAIVSGDDDVTTVELCFMLGRSYEAVKARRTKLRRQKTRPPEETTPSQVAREFRGHKSLEDYIEHHVRRWMRRGATLSEACADVMRQLGVDEDRSITAHTISALAPRAPSPSLRKSRRPRGATVQKYIRELGGRMGRGISIQEATQSAIDKYPDDRDMIEKAAAHYQLKQKLQHREQCRESA